tara:strand:- start:98 stop:1024 length:927 start_codon:yes stop_codon:yes gene_type:complete
MKIIESIDEMRDYSRQLKRDGNIVSYVGTAGALHEGHMRLVNVAKSNSDIVILSVESTASYCAYRTGLTKHDESYLNVYKEEDERLCKLNQVDVLFKPPPEELYSDGFGVDIEISGTVIARLKKESTDTSPVSNIIIQSFISNFNVISPDIIILGQKDIFQNWTVQELIKRLNFPIEVITVPTVRDKDNVACSSRLLKIDDEERLKCIYQVLQEVASWDYFPPIAKIKNYIEYKILESGGAIKYVVVCCPETMEELDSLNPLDSKDGLASLVVCAKFDGVYFHDNITIKTKSKINILIENMSKYNEQV